MTKVDDEDFEDSIKCWICDNVYVDVDVKLRNHCHKSRKYRARACRNCNINVKLYHKIPIVFHNLKSCDSHLSM